MTTDYQAFLRSKRPAATATGLDIPPSLVHDMLFPHQRDVTIWALRRGRAAIFLDTGLGKTFVQLEWLRLVTERTDGTGLIIAPLSVTSQTVEEAQKLGLSVRYVRSPEQIDGDGALYITNYESAHKFNAAAFNAVVLDESSILKSLDGKMRVQLTVQWFNTPFKLCASATPAPNDLKEIVNHSDFLGVMSRKEVFASFFINDANSKTGFKTRLKHHAVDPFYQWLASWAVAIKKPSDLGYSDEGYDLPPLNVRVHEIPVDYTQDGQLFLVKLAGVTERAAVRRETEAARVSKALELVNTHADQCIIWHQTNAEGRALAAALGDDAVLVEGSHTPTQKERRFRQFVGGTRRVLITKPSIAGMGLNFQQSYRFILMSINDSYEQYYQLVRRQYRFGQTKPVQGEVIIADAQRDIWENVQRKADGADEMTRQLSARLAVHTEGVGQVANRQRGENYVTDDVRGANWHLMLGDSTERLTEIDADSIGLSVHSPPFIARYAYTASERDLGNSSYDQFMAHYRMIIEQLYRVTMPGRNACVHLQQVRVTKRDTGNVGLIDFRGPVIQMFQDAGFVYYHEATIDKDAQIQAKRKHHIGLMFKTLNTDSSKLSGALADYLLVFKKPGDNAVAVDTDVTEQEWITYARPVWWEGVPGRTRAKKLRNMTRQQLIDLIHCQSPAWYDIDEIDVLNSQVAKADDDEMHLAPLQLGFIQRCLRLWSNPGDTVLDPFSGIGSTAYVAVQNDRKAVGIELKPEYHRTAVSNMRRAEIENSQLTLFDLMPQEEVS